MKLKENHLVLNIGKGKSDNLMDLVNSPFLKKLRKDMIAGVKNESCSICYDVEKYSDQSWRTGSFDQFKNDVHLIDIQSENPLKSEIDTFSLGKGRKKTYPKKQSIGFQKEYNTILYPQINVLTTGSDTGIPESSQEVFIGFFENGWDRYEQPNLLNRLFDSELCELVMRTEHQIQKFISLPAKISYVENNSKGEYVFELKLSRDELIKELTKIKDNPELSYEKKMIGKKN